MARRKHATALFEVINASRMDRIASPAPRKLAGGWWFARRAQPKEPPASEPTRDDLDDPTAHVNAASLMQPRREPALEVAVSHEIAVDEAWEEDPGPVVRHESADAPLTSRSGMKVNFDGDRQELTLRVRYTAAIISGFAVLAVVGLAYVIGRHMAKGPSTAHADPVASTSQIKKGPAQPGAMEVTQRQPRTTGSRDGATIRPLVGGATDPGAAQSPPNGAYADSPILADGTCRRVTNLNYLMIQRYPLEMEAAAREVTAYLNDNGVACTVEKGSARTHTTAGWYCIVSTRGFPPKFGQTREYKDYLETIEAAAAKFPTKSKLDKVAPMPFKWAE